jgi:non-canonical (house-cleaning) NTP pyrophosphatase
MRVIVGSMSQIKLAAVRKALQVAGLPTIIEVTGFPTESGVNPQPKGSQEGEKGARNRAAMARVKMAGDVHVGIENYVAYQNTDRAWFDIAAGSVLFTLPGSQPMDLLCHSGRVQVPADVMKELHKLGFHCTTAGAISAETHGHPADDPHIYWTAGKLNREEFLVQMLAPVFQILGASGVLSKG